MTSRMTSPLPAPSALLAGDVALVTGASSGLGLRFARVLASQGAKVALCARRIDRLEALAAEINAAGGTAIAIAMDATSAEDLIAAVARAEAALGLVTILINNAGVPDAQRAHKMPLDLIDRVLGINLRAPWILSCEVARRLLAAGSGGRVVNIASIAAYDYAGGGAALYSVTKAGVVRMTEALAVEWAKARINVNAIAPGLFRSEMSEGMIERTGDFTGSFPRQRIAEPEQLDTTLLYLVSPASEAVTGTCIKVDDGQHRR